MFQADHSILLIVDVQGKLATLIEDRAAVIRNIQALIKAAQILDLPYLVTEQVPEKIGKTVASITELAPYATPIEKSTFSCWGSVEFQKALKATGRKKVIISGIETHVCVTQTISDLCREGFEVAVVVDAVSSRTALDKQVALTRMQQMGATMVSTEMVITELTQSAEHPKFKEILQLIK